MALHATSLHLTALQVAWYMTRGQLEISYQLCPSELQSSSTTSNRALHQACLHSSATQ